MNKENKQQSKDLSETLKYKNSLWKIQNKSVILHTIFMYILETAPLSSRFISPLHVIIPWDYMTLS